MNILIYINTDITDKNKLRPEKVNLYYNTI